MTPAISRPLGIDVSHHNGVVNWERVKKSKKIQLAFIKATEGMTAVDSAFQYNWNHSRWDGDLIRGAYHYGHIESDPVKQASHFVDTVKDAGNGKLYAGDFLALDAEDVCDLSKKIGKVKTNAWVDEFMKTIVKRSGLPTNRCFIYTGAWWWIPRVGNVPKIKYPLWLSAYSEKPVTIPGWAWTIWQFTNSGTVPGVPGRVDMNEYRGTPRQLRKQAGYP